MLSARYARICESYAGVGIAISISSKARKKMASRRRYITLPIPLINSERSRYDASSRLCIAMRRASYIAML